MVEVYGIGIWYRDVEAVHSLLQGLTKCNALSIGSEVV